MNISAAYTPSPDVVTRQDLVVSRQSKPEITRAENMLVPAGKNSYDESTKYNYYVLSNENDIIYNNNKNTEKMNTWITGSLIDVYA